MNYFKLFVCSVLGLSVLSASAAEERETFRKWRIGVGGALNCGVKSHLQSRNVPVPSKYSIPTGSTRAEAEERAGNREYDDGFVRPDNIDNGFTTENWQLSEDSYLGDGLFRPGNSYEEVIDSDFAYNRRDSSDDECQFGLAIELSRELWIHDENDEHRWGVDFAAALSYFFQRDIYSARGTVTRSDTVKEGSILTDINDPDAMFKYDNDELTHNAGDPYGYGNATADFNSPTMRWSALGSPYDDPNAPTRTESSSLAFSAKGDYRELEILLMLRPWYEIKDWWRVFGEVGLGISWGKFDSSFYGQDGVGGSEDFDQWDCYGVAGLGTAFRYDDFDIVFDIFGRFWRDDLDVKGKYVSGDIERAGWGMRLMLCYEF